MAWPASGVAQRIAAMQLMGDKMPDDVALLFPGHPPRRSLPARTPRLSNLGSGPWRLGRARRAAPTSDRFGPVSAGSMSRPRWPRIFPELRIWLSKSPPSNSTQSIYSAWAAAACAQRCCGWSAASRAGIPSSTCSTRPTSGRSRAAASRLDPARTLFLVSSKSGGTVEVASLERFFWARIVEAEGSAAGRHFVAITDPGTALQALAESKDYREVFLNPADIGGRFSALSLFGLVPAALIGADAGDLLAAGPRWPKAAARRTTRTPGSCSGRSSVPRSSRDATS